MNSIYCRCGHSVREKLPKGKSFFNTVLLSLLMVSLLATIVLTSFLTAHFIKTSAAITTGFNQNLLAQTNYTINQMNDNVDLLMQTLYSNKDILSFLYMEKPDSLNTILVSQVMDKQIITMPFIESIYLYNASLDVFFSSKTGEFLNSEAFSDTDIRDLVTDPGFITSYEKIPIPTKMEAVSNKASRLSYFMFDSYLVKEGRQNAIIVNVLPFSLTSSISSMNQFQDGMLTNFIVADQSGNILSSVLNPSLDQDQDLFSSLSIDPGKNRSSTSYVTIHRTKYLQSITQDNENHWYLISLVEAKVIFRDILLSALFGAAIMILVLLACCVVCLCLARRLNSPIKAIARIVKGEASDPAISQLQGTEEFRLILSSFDSMQEQNRQFDKIRRETAYSARQDYLNNLISGSVLDSASQTARKLQDMNLSYLLENDLCMIVFKIDNYQGFLAQNNPKELWLLRFAIVNIMEEIMGHFFTGNVLNRDNDKFVVILNCSDVSAHRVFVGKTEKMIREVQENISRCINITLTASYSTLFRGLDHLPSMFNTMEDLLLLKMKYGHGAVISPHMMDEVETNIYQFPETKLDQLIFQITEGKWEPAQKIYLQITSQLFLYDYNEIISSTIHLLYSLYQGIQKKYPELKENATGYLRTCLSDLQDTEIMQDITLLVENYIKLLCHDVTALQDSPAQQNTLVITKRICEIIERDYPNPALCLSSIAEEIGLTSNYLGKIFKATMQMSVSQYILDYRMDKLAEYLPSALPLNEILDKVGIEKTNYFYTQFKKHFGISLMEYRTRPGD